MRFGIVLAATIAVCCSSCRDEVSKSDLLRENAKKGFVAFVGAGPNDPVWPVLKKSAEQYGKLDTGADVRIFTPANDSPQAQIELLKGLRDPQMRGLCIQVKDASLVTPTLQQLHVRGIAIVSMVEPAPEKVRFAHVGVDETAVGQELARGTIEGLGQAGGTIMLLHAGYDHPVYGSRYLAFMEGIKTASQISLLGEFNCHADAGEARQIIRERSQRFPRLTAWVSLCDWPLQDGYSPDDVFPKGMRYITFGGYPRQWPLIRNGLCPAIVAVDYKQVGGQALQFCYSAVRDPAQAQRLARVPLTQLNLINVDEYERDWMAWLRDDSQ